MRVHAFTCEQLYYQGTFPSRTPPSPATLSHCYYPKPKMFSTGPNSDVERSNLRLACERKGTTLGWLLGEFCLRVAVACAPRSKAVLVAYAQHLCRLPHTRLPLHVLEFQHLLTADITLPLYSEVRFPLLVGHKDRHLNPHDEARKGAPEKKTKRKSAVHSNVKDWLIICDHMLRANTVVLIEAVEAQTGVMLRYSRADAAGAVDAGGDA